MRLDAGGESALTEHPWAGQFCPPWAVDGKWFGGWIRSTGVAGGATLEGLGKLVTPRAATELGVAGLSGETLGPQGAVWSELPRGGRVSRPTSLGHVDLGTGWGGGSGVCQEGTATVPGSPCRFAAVEWDLNAVQDSFGGGVGPLLGPQLCLT